MPIALTNEEREALKEAKRTHKQKCRARGVNSKKCINPSKIVYARDSNGKVVRKA